MKSAASLELRPALRIVAKLHDAVGDDGAEPGLADRGGDLVGEEVLVAERRRSREHHLGAAQRHGGPDVAADQRQLGLADRVVPAVHREEALALGAAPEEDHRGVGVGVDEARHHQMAGEVEDLVETGAIGLGFARADTGDPAIADGDPAIREGCIRGIHGEHSGSVDKR